MRSSLGPSWRIAEASIGSVDLFRFEGDEGGQCVSLEGSGQGVSRVLKV